jgi:hypothetical protein
MSTEASIQDKLLPTYNALLQINTPEANALAANIAAQINVLLQRNLDKPPSIELSQDLQALLKLKTDTLVLGQQEQYKTFLWVCLLSVLLYIVYVLISK